MSRFQFGASDVGPHNPAFAEAEARTAARNPAVTDPWTPPKGLSDVYIAMGQTAENVAEYEKVTREEMDEFAGAQPEPGRGVPEERVLRARDHPRDPRGRHRGHQGRRAPGRHHGRGPRRAEAGVPRGRHHHGRQRLSA